MLIRKRFFLSYLFKDWVDDLFWFGMKVRSLFWEKLEKRFACKQRFARALRSFTVFEGLDFKWSISCCKMKASSSSAKNCSLLDRSIS